MKPPLSHAPMLAMAIGVVAAILFPAHIPWGIGAAICAGGIIMLGRRQLRMAALAIAGFGAGIASSDLNRLPTGFHLHESTSSYRAIVTDAAATDYGQRLTLSLTDTLGRHVKAIVTYAAHDPQPRVADSIIIRCAMSPLRHDTSPHADTYTRVLARRGVVAEAYLPRDSLAIAPMGAHGLYSSLRRLQHRVVDLLRESPLSYQTASFLAATIAGRGAEVDAETRREFRTAGLSHLLALSGTHVGIISGIIMIGLFPLYWYRQRRLLDVVTVALLWMFAAMTGFSPSVTRAVTVATCLAAGRMLNRPDTVYNYLLAAATAILIASPTDLAEPGFQMSFMAAFAIAALMQIAARWRNRTNYRIVAAAMTIAVPIVATAATAVLTLIHFHIFPLYFLPANIPVAMLMPVELALGAIVIVCQAVGITPVLSAWLADRVYDLISGIAATLSALPGATLSGMYFSPWAALPYYTALIALAAYLLGHGKRWGAWALASGLCTIAVAWATTPVYATEEWFIPHDTSHTGIIYRCDTTALYIVPSGMAGAGPTAVETVGARHSEYLDRRHCATLARAADTVQTSSLRRQGNLIGIDTTRIFLLAKSIDTIPYCRPHYLIICRGFTGDVVRAAHTAGADTVVVGSDVNHRRHDRYMAELDSAAIPAISLRRRTHTPVHIASGRP